MNKQFGFIPPTFEDNHYVLGASNSLVKLVLQSDGQWDAYLPERETQNIGGVETYNCTSFGTCNIFEMLFNKIYKQNNNFSDRYVGIQAGTKPPGNDPHKVVEAIRHWGLIPEAMLPFKDILNWEEYYSYKGGNALKCELQGKDFLSKWSIGHEWVFQDGEKNKQDKMIECLRYSPLGVSVSAWYEENGLFVDKGEPNNHWGAVYGYVKGEYWKVFDSYDLSTKRLAWDFNFQYCKRYGLMLNTQKQYSNVLSKFIDILKIYVAILTRQVGSIITGVFQPKN